jgi:hypothetical protein
MDSVKYEVTNIRQYVLNRQNLVRIKITKYLDIGGNGRMTVNIERNDNAAIRFNTCDVNDFDYDFTGSYFSEGSFPLSVKVREGWQFDYYLINDKKYTSPEMMITADLAENNRISISVAVSPKTMDCAPVIDTIDYENAEDLIILANPYTVPVNLHGLYISDDPADPFRQALPDRTIEPGGEIKLYCENNSDAEALGNYYVDFNLKCGETLTITDSNEQTVTSVYLPELDREFIYVRDTEGYGEYRAVLQQTHED